MLCKRMVELSSFKRTALPSPDAGNICCHVNGLIDSRVIRDVKWQYLSDRAPKILCHIGRDFCRSNCRSYIEILTDRFKYAIKFVEEHNQELVTVV